MKKVSIIKLTLMRATLTLALIVTCAAAWADNDPVTYIAADGTTLTCTDYTVLHTGDDVSNLPGGWYVVSENAQFSSKMNFTGSASIILCDGKTLTVNNGETSGISAQYNLTIYGQSGQSGTLNASTTDINGIYAGSDITINGGIVSGNGDGMNGIRGSSITINRGTVTGTGSSIGIFATGSGNSITINGGNVTATGSNGIYANPGNITLGWTNYTDFINASSYYARGSVAIATGKTLYDGTTGYTSTLSNQQINNIGGKTLRPYSSNDFSVNDAGTEYTIHNATGWDVFCDYIEGGESFNGKTVKLGADITITRMASTGAPYFRGTFDGQGHTLTLDYGTASNPVDAQFVAPFVMTVWNTSPTFRNLNISGHIYSTCTDASITEKNTGGLIGHLYGNVTIEHCTSNVEITSTGGAGGFVGLCERTVSFNDCLSSTIIHSAEGNNSGFVGWTRSRDEIHFTGCVFNGKLLKVDGIGHDNGGFIGWKGANRTVTITNCLYAPAALAEGEAYASDNSATFSRENTNFATITNSYYTTDFNDGTHYTGQGTQAHSITAGNFVTAANAGTATAYATSGITGYGTGIKYNDVLYAGSGESVALTISNTVPASFNFTGYSVTEGATLNASGNDYTLTMPNAEVDVVITANCTIPPVSYIDENGVAQTCTYYYPLESTETTLGTEDQETWYVVNDFINYYEHIEIVGEVHLILKDGAEMNVGTKDEPISDYTGISYPDNYSYTDEVHSSFSVYAQSTGADKGQLNVNVDKESATGISVFEDLTINGGQVTVNANGNNTNGISSNGSLTINGGQVTVNANGNQSSYGISSDGSLTINGGQVTNVNGNNIYGINSTNSLTINGGQVTANGLWGIYTLYGNVTIEGGQVEITGGECGIFASNITLGWTNPTDYIYANSYITNGTLTLTKTFIDEDGHTYSGTIAMENETYPINGKTLRPEGVIIKQVIGYGNNTESDHWVFIASPVQDSLAPSEVYNLLGQKISTDPEPALYDFDLYRLNPSTTRWENYHAHTADFKLVNGMGYLYASKEDRTLVFAGEFNTDNSKEVTLQQGWNLVGNPFVKTAYIYDGRRFYVMNADGSEIMAAADPNQNSIAPMEGIIVQPEDDNNKVTFCTQVPGKGRGPKPEIEQVVLNLSRERGNVIDRAIVRMGESQTLPKFQIRENSTKIYLPQGGKDYAVACSNGQGEMPVNFRAKENGTYTITVNPEGVQMAYLHLIDNMTGADIDLLPLCKEGQGDSQPVSYTFTATTTDYESRFKLVFCTGVNDDSDSFAFISNGNIIINGEGTLQIIDVMGHVIVSRDGVHTVSTNGMTAGVYVLRLINGDDVKVQKIVVE